MKRSCQRSLVRWCWFSLLCSIAFPSHGLWAAPAPQLATDATELSEEESRQVKTAERFLDILFKNPRYGTALDRVYGHHVEFGSLENFLQSLRARAEQGNDGGAAWMLVGMVESQRGNDAAAAEALQKADQLRPQDALASYYLGQAQLRIGQSQEAVASFERAIERRPPRTDLLEIFQTLGRVHQRAQRTEQAMAVWQRLESLFPDDPRVLEQIAITLADEGQPELALPRYQKLVELARDEYRQVMYGIAAAELTIKTGQRDAGLQAFENLLQDLNPESWLYRDVRRRIDDVFLRSGDQDSLVKYYQGWLDKQPDDVETMARLAKFLAASARVPEATQWMEQALKLAPTRADLRKAFIDQLVNDQRFTEAIDQYELLLESAPGNTDYLREWGKLVLRNRDVPEEERITEATGIWNQILATRPDDALTTAQVADLFRQNKIADQAEQLYRRAIELAPGDPQYREYLGEFLHIQGRSSEALEVWAGIAEGTRRTAANVNRLAEVYNSFGFADKAIVEIAEAVDLDPKDFSLHIRAADYHLKAEKYEAALAFVGSASALAANDDERDAVIQQRIEVLQVSQQLDKVADELLAQLKGAADATADQWYLAARYLEAGRRWPDATDAIDTAIKLQPKSIPALVVAGRIAETSGDYGRAAEAYRTLAELDRRSRGDHLMNVSRLEAQLGRTDEALKAAYELIVAAPGNTDNYEFYAQTCFRFGKSDEGLEALRKAVRINPNEPHLIMALGAALATQLRTDEAIEVYWRAFEKMEEVEDKVGLTMKITPLYQQISQLDKLIERLERDRREEDKRRELTICLAQAWHTAGDLGAARQELEGLLSENTRDTNLLSQLAKLCQEAADLDAAIGYQQQLVAIAPGHETEFPLAGMLMASGQVEEAREIYVKLTQREEDPVRQMRALDSLITQGNFESAIGVIESLLAQNRDDWELLYREGVAWASLDKSQEAINRFERILALRLPYDALGRSAAARLKQAQAKAKSDNLRGITSAAPQKQSPLAMRSMSSQVQMATGLTADNRFYGSNQLPPVWTPEAFGAARMAALGWLMRFESDAQAAPSIVDEIREKAHSPTASREAIYDWLYVAHLKNDYPAIFDIARRLAASGGKEEQQFYLSSLKLRHSDVNQMAVSSSPAPSGNRTPLEPEELQLARECFQRLHQDSKNIDLEALYGGNVAYGSNGQAYVLVGGTYTLLPGVFRGAGAAFLTVLIDELRLAGQTEGAAKMLDEHLASAATANELAAAMALLLTEERIEDIPPLFERWLPAALKQVAQAPVTAASRGASRSASTSAGANVLSVAQNTLQRWMAKLGAEEENALVLSILDRCLDVAEAEASYRRQVLASQTRRTQTPPTTAAAGRLSIYYGKESKQVTISFPPLNNWIDHASCSLLYQAHEVLKNNDVGADLTDLLQKRLAAAADSQNNERLVCRQFSLAAALWWAEEQDEAVERMARAAELAADDLAMQFSLATIYETAGEFDEALAVLEKITPRDQKVLQARELQSLQLAERLGDTERARLAAERLFGLRLDSQTQLGLVPRMRRLGLGAMADAILARAERTASNQTSSLASLMMLYQGQGKTEQANQLAHMLLRKTTSPINITIRTGRNPTRYRTSDSALRTQALQLLQQSGALTDLISQLEEQLARSPDSIPALQQLIEFYGNSNQKDDALRIIERGLQVRPDSPMLRLQFAKHLDQSGKFNEACDQYLELLQLAPSWVTEELYQIDRVFTQAKRKTDLVESLSQINMKRIGEPWYVVQTASGLLSSEETLDAGLKLLEQAFEAFPTYRRYLTQNIRNTKIWSNDRFYRFAKRIVLPTAQDISNSPWSGLDTISSFGANGNVEVFFHQMLQGLKTTDKLPDLETTLAEHLEQHPQWHGGQTMLALLEFATGRKTEGQSRLKELVEDESIFDGMPAEACWIVGQELDQFDDTRELAVKLFERAIANPSSNSSNQLQYSPVARLITSYSRAGRGDEAKAILLKQLAAVSFDQYDPQYASYQRIETSTWAAQQLIKLESPVEAIKIYRGLLNKPEELSLAAQWQGRPGNYYENSLQKSLTAALKSVNEKNTDEVISQLLLVAEDRKPGTPAIDLMLTIPDAQNLAKGEIRSSFTDVLKMLAADAQTAERISSRLAKLTAEHPQDVSVAIAHAAWQLQTAPEQAADAVRALLALAMDQPLEAVPEGRRPNSRQRREAALLVPLWLVARECLVHDELQSEGRKLAEVSRSAAARQVAGKEQAAILFEWGQRLLEAGHKQQAEARWSELLDAATQRPGKRTEAQPKTSYNNRIAVPWLLVVRPATLAHGLLTVMQPPAGRPQTAPLPRSPGAASGRPAAGPAAGQAASRSIPPLTLSQFRTVLAVAKAAAESGMPELSRRAVSESLDGGFPVADPVAGITDPSGIRVIRPSSTTPATDPIETEVVTSLAQVLAVWDEQDYPSEATYELLKSLVLPASHPHEVRLYVTVVDMANAKVTSLAEPLVAAAGKAGKFDELRAAVDDRAVDPASQTASAALSVLIEVGQLATDRAQEQLNQLAGRISGAMSIQDKHLAFLAALRAFEHDQLKAAALPILQHMVQLGLQTVNQQNPSQSISGTLASMVNRYLATAGEEQTITLYLEQLLNSRQAAYSNYVGDYALYMQQRDLIALAEQAAELRLLRLAADYLGRAVDFELTQYGTPDFGAPLALVIRQLRSLPAAERYAIWHQWTMPGTGRQTLRALYQNHAPHVVPQAFLGEEVYQSRLTDRLLSNLAELVAAAKEAEQLDALRAELLPLVDAKAKAADVLLALVLIAQEDVAAGAPHIEALQATFVERMKAASESNITGRRTLPNTLADYLVFQACLQSPSFVQVVEQQLPTFRKQLQQHSASAALQNINLDWARRTTATHKPSSIAPSEPFAHWQPVAAVAQPSSQLPWWATFDDHLISLGGPGGSQLIFRYPLTGARFTIHLDCLNQDWAESNAGFGGVLVSSVGTAGSTQVSALGGHETLNRPARKARKRPSFEQLTIEVVDGQVRHLLNKQLVYQEPVSPTSPWLVLFTNGSRMSGYRNLRFSGDVTIPDHVKLIVDQRMDGWRCDAFGESQPRHRLMKETPASENDSVFYYQQNEPTEFDWRALEGVLHGKAADSPGENQQSWLYYQRPLMDGETFAYEFYYVPGTKVAHPTIGQLAFVLSPDGLQSHWIATRQEQSLYGIEPDNSLVEAAIRRGPTKLPLNANAWNSVQLQLVGDVAKLTLNGSVVGERPLEPELGRQFGFFRHKHQSSQIRNVELRGTWPSTLPDGTDLLETARPVGSESLQTVAAIVDESMIALQAGEVLAAARSMATDEAYDYLTQWVLPSDSHRNVRLYYCQTGLTAADESQEYGFGAIAAPAIELIRLASELQRTDELKQSLSRLATATPSGRRDLAAFQTLIALHSNPGPEAQALLKAVWKAISQPYPAGTDARQRSGDFLVAWSAGQHPQHWSQGSDIARKLRDYERKTETSSGDADFQRQVHALVGDIERMARGVPLAATLGHSTGSSQWSAVPYLKPEHRWAGYRSSTWTLSNGSAEHLPADIWSQLVFQSPLRGKFEIVASRTTHGHKEVSIGWGMHSAEPIHDLKGVRVAKIMHSSVDVNKAVQLPTWDQQADFRIVVDGRKVTTWTNGVQIHQEIFETDPDPWLVLQSQKPTSYARVSDLRILGSPEIPSEIDLIRMAGLAGWRADIYNEWFRTEANPDSNENVPWLRVNDELIGQLDKNTTNEYRESLLMYQRPMLEDGVIEFETWYEPGVFEVHPALGRQAVLLTPDGVRLHLLTDAQYETSGRTADNQQPIADALAPLPLKVKDWNQVRLALQGDQLTIVVNGIQAATLPIPEAAHARQFGLFRYANRTQARVRNLIYRGQWPTHLPAVTEQQLAASHLTAQLPEATNVVDADLSQPETQLGSLGLALRGSQERRSGTAQGLQLRLSDAKTSADHPGIVFEPDLAGDCEMTVVYQNIEMKPQKSGWGVSLVFQAILDDPQRTSVECNVSLDKSQQLQHTTQILRTHAGGGRHTVDQQFLHPATSSGKLRMVRRGGQIDCYIAADGSDDFRLVNSLTVGPANIREVACLAKASDEVGQVNVTLTQLTIRQLAAPRSSVSPRR